LRIAAERAAGEVRVGAAVSHDRVSAELFEAVATVRAGAARIDKAPDADEVALSPAILRTNSSERDANFDCLIAIQRHLEMPGRR
jgi:hypothetical protein